MNISLVIPSTQNHFQYLDCVLKNYKNGTELPNEVIVSLSNAHLVPTDKIDELEKKYQNQFDVFKILRHNRTIQEGPNRGEGSKASTCDYITYHDSDDIPHPQRIEIIKHFFKNYDILHLNHSYTYEQGFNTLKIDEIKHVDSEKIYRTHFGDSFDDEKQRPIYHYNNLENKSYGNNQGFHVCGGPTTIHKSVLDTVKWNDERILSYDYDFCMDTLFYLKKSMIIDAPLIWYNKVGNIEFFC